MEKANSSKWKSGSNSVALRYGLCFVSLGQGERRDSCGRRREPPSHFTANDWTTMWSGCWNLWRSGPEASHRNLHKSQRACAMWGGELAQWHHQEKSGQEEDVCLSNSFLRITKYLKTQISSECFFLLASFLKLKHESLPLDASGPPPFLLPVVCPQAGLSFVMS